MTGAPPPYGYDPRQQARAARQQIKQQLRAQRDALRLQQETAKAQRDLYRYQARGLRRGSILGPVLVLAAGVILLLVRLGSIPAANFWTWYGHWWPLLLVLAGVALVAEWMFDQQTHTTDTPYQRRSVGAGTIFLLLLLALVGASIQGIGFIHLDNGINLGFDPDSLHQFFSEKYERTQDLDAAFTKGSTLAVENPHGDIEITGKSDDDKVHVVVTKQIYGTSESDADANAARLNVTSVQVGSTVRITVPTVDGNHADLAITVPDFAETTITADNGDVSVSGMHAPVVITSNRGDVEAQSVSGPVTAHLNSVHSSFAAHDVTGDVTLRGRADDVSVTGVTGHTSIEGEFFGDTHLERLKGTASFRTSRTQLSFQRLDGELDISPHADLTGNDIVGPSILRTRSRNITLDRIAGDVTVANSDGSVDLTAVAPLGSIQVDNKDGVVNLSVPENASFTLDAETRGGNLDVDELHLAQKTETNANGRSGVRGSSGTGGPGIMLRTTHLDINVRRNNSPASTP